MCNDEMCRQSTYAAARNGHLECLRYAHENGCAWHPKTTYTAALNGHLECLKYAHENGCRWHSRTTYNAACNGRLECLRYARENGCEWHPETTYIAVYNGHLECLKYVYENCGDVETWKDAKLEDETGIVSEEFSKDIQYYIDADPKIPTNLIYWNSKFHQIISENSKKESDLTPGTLDFSLE